MAQGSTEVHENVPSVLLSEAMLMCIGCAPWGYEDVPAAMEGHASLYGLASAVRVLG